MKIRIVIVSLLLIFLSCKSEQKKNTEIKKIIRVSVIPFQNKINPQEKTFSQILNSAIISSISFSDKCRYVDEEFEKYYIYNSMQIAQSIGDQEFEKFLKDIIVIHGKENPGIDTYITGYYIEKESKVSIYVKIIEINGKQTEFQIDADHNSIESMRNLSHKILTSLEPKNLQGIENLDLGFTLTKNYAAYKLYLEGREEKRKKTIYGYMNAIRKFQASLREDGLYLLALNEIIHTLSQISTDLIELIKQESIINNSKIIADTNAQLKRNGEILQNAIGIYNVAKRDRPEEYEQLLATFDKSPFKKQYEVKASLFKNQMELLLLRWEEEKFGRESIVKGQIKRINSGYAPLLVTDFFQTLTNSRINVNDILRALLTYAKEHPENRYYIHYFKNFSRLMKTLNEFDYMQLNSETNFSYHQLHQEYIFYIREYLNVMRDGLK
ncbi:MAG: hypothetical protein KA146_11735 [Leptospiraceae bacterium]|jgi:hypothetical protein|nr:hypothetical protein [Leptospiraceae bacterium]